ncbi:MAG: cyanophycin synthetase [Blastocatellia bacterium]
MKIGTIRALRGPNIYSYQPTLVMELQLEELTGRESYDIPGFIDPLLTLLPGMHDHHCALGAPGGFIQRLHGGTWFGHIVEHVALELTELAGVPVFHGKTRAAHTAGQFNVAVEYRAEKGTEYLLRAAVDLVEALVKGEPYPLAETISEAKRIIARTELGPSTHAIVTAAEQRGIPWRRLNEDSLVQFGYGKHRKWIAAALTSQTSALAVETASDKDLTKQLLAAAGLPVPQGAIVHSAEEAIGVMEWLHKPVAVKPYNGCQGKGVSLNLYTPEQVVEAFHIAHEHSPDVLVEELFVGRDFRALIVNGKLIAASERLPAQVIGDGVHSIAELIEIENRNPLRGEGHAAALTKIAIDEVMTAHLQKSSYAPDSIPGKGEQVWLRQNANLSQGGTAVDVTDIVHPQVRQVCERAARVIGLDICGIDLVLHDISEPIKKIGAGIIEVNAAPGLRMHTSPSIGQPRDVGAAIIEMMYPADVTIDARIPIVSITGTNGKTTITRLIARLLADTGVRVGMTTTDGIYLNDELIAPGDTTGPRSTRTILSEPTVDAAVLEVARGGIVRGGLGYDWSDISVLSNIQADHLGQDGINTIDDLLFIKSLVAERVRAGGTLILNADDERLAQLAEHPRISKVPKQIVYYSLDANHPLIRHSPTAYTVRDGWLIERANGQETRVIEATAVPLTLGGALPYQISNVLAALAAARAYGLGLEQIATTLQQSTGITHNAGRANLYRVGQGRVLVDYGHNPQAFAAVGQALRVLQPSRFTGVIGVPGDRNNEVIQQAGQAAAQHFDRVIIKEDQDLRGRTSGEVAHLLCRAANDARPDLQCRLILNEQNALEVAIREMQPNEIVAIFYEKLAPILQILERYQAVPEEVISAQQVTLRHSLAGVKR